MLLGEFVWKFKLLAVNYVARLMYIYRSSELVPSSFARSSYIITINKYRLVNWSTFFVILTTCCGFEPVFTR